MAFFYTRFVMGEERERERGVMEGGSESRGEEDEGKKKVKGKKIKRTPSLWSSCSAGSV